MSRQSVAAQKAAGQRGQFGELPQGSNGGIVLDSAADDGLREALLAVHPQEWWDQVGSFDDESLADDILTAGEAVGASHLDAYVVAERPGGDAPESIDVMVPVPIGDRTFFLTETIDLDSFQPDHDDPGIGNAAHYLSVMNESFDRLRDARSTILAASKPQERPYAIVQGGVVQDSAVEVETVDLDWMDGDEDDVPDTFELERQAGVLRQAMTGGGMWQGELARIEEALAAREAEEG